MCYYHIFSHLCDCDMLAGERSVAGSLGLVPGSLWGSAILVWELRSVRSRAMSTTRERPSDGTAELSREVEILPWWCGKRNWPAVVWRSALRWGRGGRCCRGSPRRRSLATKLPRDWSRPTLPASDHIKCNNFICEFRSGHAMTKWPPTMLRPDSAWWVVGVGIQLNIKLQRCAYCAMPKGGKSILFTNGKLTQMSESLHTKGGYSKVAKFALYLCFV